MVAAKDRGLNSDLILPGEMILTDSVNELTKLVLVVNPGAGNTSVGIAVFTQKK